MRFESEFDLRDRVMIDGDPTIVGRIVAIRWSRDALPTYEVSWIHEGRAEYVYFDEWRLTRG
jgi:hypothetical protein